MASRHGLTEAQLEYLRARPAYPFLLWVTRIWIVGLVALMVLAILGGQFAVALFCVMCVVAVLFLVARRTVEVQMHHALEGQSPATRRQMRMAIWFIALRDSFLRPK